MSWHYFGTSNEVITLAAILDQLPIAILLVDKNANVEYANTTAESATLSGEKHTIVDNVIRGGSRSDAIRLRTAIAETCTKRKGHAIVLGRSNSKATIAVTVPFTRDQPDDG